MGLIDGKLEVKNLVLLSLSRDYSSIWKHSIKRKFCSSFYDLLLFFARNLVSNKCVQTPQYFYRHTQLITKDTAHTEKDVLNYTLLISHGNAHVCAKIYVIMSRFFPVAVRLERC
jgi:hypothetical protein